MDRERSRRYLDEAGRLLLLPLQQPGDLLLGLLAFAEVTQNLDVPLEAAVLQGRDQAARPKAAPVLANEPVIVGRPACGPRRLEFPLWFAGQPIFGSVELCERLSDDLFRLVAQEAFRPGVPTGHLPAWVHEEEGVVAHALDQQTEPLFALPERPFPGFTQSQRLPPRPQQHF